MRRRRAFGLLELALLIASAVTILIVLGLILKPRKNAGIQCVVNVKMAALSFRMWANDHSEKFPWEIPINEGGSKEFVGTGKVFAHFQAVSNELNTPKVLVCPQDPNRAAVPIRDAVNVPVFDFISNSNISYFVGTTEPMGRTNALISGDPHISTNRTVTSGTLDIPNAAALNWAPVIHRGGNVVRVDGSAYQLGENTTNALSFAFPVRLEIP